ncbi:hypothetical protein VB735_01420 [Halotia wernerae UHCC 0503]|nr:hypothetical protein [Halotia wernerae UHCC 0503]
MPQRRRGEFGHVDPMCSSRYARQEAINMKTIHLVGATLLFGVLAALIGTDALGAYFLLLMFVGFPILIASGVVRHRRQSDGLKIAIAKLKREKGPFALEVPSRPALLANEETRTMLFVGALIEESYAVEILELPFDGIARVQVERIEATTLDKLCAPASKEKWQIRFTLNKIEHPTVRLQIGENEFDALELERKLSAILSR